MLGERTKDIRGADEAEEGEDLVEVVVRLFVIIVGHHGTSRGSVRIRHDRHVNTVLSLTTL